MEQFIDALKAGTGYDFLSIHGHDLTKDQLIRISLEFIYATMEQFIDALKAGTGYDFLSIHGHDLTKDQLIRISLEFIYATKEKAVTESVTRKLIDSYDYLF